MVEVKKKKEDKGVRFPVITLVVENISTVYFVQNDVSMMIFSSFDTIYIYQDGIRFPFYSYSSNKRMGVCSLLVLIKKNNVHKP